jgi:hypothetical protein
MSRACSPVTTVDHQHVEAPEEERVDGEEVALEDACRLRSHSAQRLDAFSSVQFGRAGTPAATRV